MIWSEDAMHEVVEDICDAFGASAVEDMDFDVFSKCVECSFALADTSTVPSQYAYTWVAFTGDASTLSIAIDHDLVAEFLGELQANGDADSALAYVNSIFNGMKDALSATERACRKSVDGDMAIKTFFDMEEPNQAQLLAMAREI